MEEYRDELSEKVIGWQTSAARFPDDLWTKAYVIEQTQGRRWRKRFNDVDMDDAVQDVAVETPKIASEYQGRAKFSTVLKAALRYKAIQYLRTRRIHSYHMRDFFDKRVHRRRANTYHRRTEIMRDVQRSELGNLINDVLNKLSHEQASILTYAAENIPYSVVASVLGTSVDGVKSRVYRARTEFRRIFASSGPGKDYLNETVTARFACRKLRKANRTYTSKVQPNPTTSK